MIQLNTYNANEIVRMAVIMSRFCCCKGANLRLGSIVVGVLSSVIAVMVFTIAIGSGFLLVMGILGAVMTYDREPMLHNPNATEHYSSRTISHWRETLDLEYLNIVLYLISFIVAGLLVYGAIKRIRPLLYTYIVWTIIIVLLSFGGLIYFTLDAPRFVVAIFVFNFCLLLSTAIYFILVVYSYSELLRVGGEQQVPTQVTMVPDEDYRGQWDSKQAYTRFQNQPEDPGMGDDRVVLTA